MTGSISPELPGKGDPRGTADSKVRKSLVTLRDGLNDILNEANDIDRPVTWYTPKVIAAEESRTNTAFGTLETKDEINGVEVPTNGLIAVGYAANVKCSVEGAGRAAIFIGANQLKSVGAAAESTIDKTTFKTMFSSAGGLSSPGGAGGAALGTTGEALTSGLCHIFLAAGTYSIAVKYRATSGSVTAKERRLWVAVLGR